MKKCLRCDAGPVRIAERELDKLAAEINAR